jgi:hypothetical protein
MQKIWIQGYKFLGSDSYFQLPSAKEDYFNLVIGYNEPFFE